MLYPKQHPPRALSPAPSRNSMAAPDAPADDLHANSGYGCSLESRAPTGLQQPDLGAELRPLLAELHDALQAQHGPALALLKELRQDVMWLKERLAAEAISPASGSPPPPALPRQHDLPKGSSTPESAVDTSRPPVVLAEASRPGRRSSSAYVRASHDLPSFFARTTTTRYGTAQSAAERPNDTSTITKSSAPTDSSNGSGAQLPTALQSITSSRCLPSHMPGAQSRSPGSAGTEWLTASSAAFRHTPSASHADIFHTDTAHLGVNSDLPSAWSVSMKFEDMPWTVDRLKGMSMDMTRQLNEPSFIFRSFSAILILVHTVIIGLEQGRAVEDAFKDGGTDRKVFFHLQMVIVALLVLELGLRRLIEGSRFWSKNFLLGNGFDIVLINLGVAHLIAQWQYEGNKCDLLCSTLKLFECLPVLRVLRLVHLLPSLHTMRMFVAMFRTSLGVFFWAIIILVSLLYTYAVVICSYLSRAIIDGDVLIGTDRFGTPKCNDAALWEATIMEMYIDLPTTMYTLFGAMSGGLDWLPAAEPLRCTKWGPLMYSGFAVFVALAQFCLCNILLASIIEGAHDVLQMDERVVIRNQVLMERAQGSRLYRVFSQADKDGSGTICRSEVEVALRDPDARPYLQSLGVSAAEVWGVFNLLDKGVNGHIDLMQFVQKIFTLRGPSKNVDLVSLITAQRNSCRLLDEFQREVYHKLERIERTLEGTLPLSQKVEPPPIIEDGEASPRPHAELGSASVSTSGACTSDATWSLVPTRTWQVAPAVPLADHLRRTVRAAL